MREITTGSGEQNGDQGHEPDLYVIPTRVLDGQEHRTIYEALQRGYEVPIGLAHSVHELDESRRRGEGLEPREAFVYAVGDVGVADGVRLEAVAGLRVGVDGLYDRLMVVGPGLDHETVDAWRERATALANQYLTKAQGPFQFG
ncbi:MAG TPA: hypothetical protein VJP80_08055 [Candidatus Saccharimonadales bacterium]|nr:hypothetical protein [Candidatus Saccharimonadales bacterium]